MAPLIVQQRVGHVLLVLIFLRAVYSLHQLLVDLPSRSLLLKRYLFIKCAADVSGSCSLCVLKRLCDHNQRGSKQSASWLRLAGVPPRSGRWMVVLHSALYTLLPLRTTYTSLDLATSLYPPPPQPRSTAVSHLGLCHSTTSDREKNKEKENAKNKHKTTVDPRSPNKVDKDLDAS